MLGILLIQLKDVYGRLKNKSVNNRKDTKCYAQDDGQPETETLEIVYSGLEDLG